MEIATTNPNQRYEWQTRISADHPALPGHFPGNPIVPGVVLISEVLRAARALIDADLVLCGLPNVKFTAPVWPGDTLLIVLEVLEVLEPAADDQIRFSMLRDTGEDAQPVVSGSLRCTRVASTEERRG